MKLIYLLVLIIAICVVIAFIYFRLEKTRKDLYTLKNKVETKLIKNNKNSSCSESESLSLTSIKSEKKDNQKNINSKKIEINNTKTNELFGGLNIPNLFQMFSPTNFKDFINSENMIIHPKIPNLETTSDIESLDTSQIESLSDRSINIDGTKSVMSFVSNILEEKGILGNIEPTDSNVYINTVNQTIDDATECVGKDEDHIEVYSNSDKSVLDQITDNINTDKELTTIDTNETLEKINNTLDKDTLNKKELENMKVSELKTLAKKKNINLFIGKKPKNKLELISDISKIYSIINI
jgi:hypothetical protein